MRFESQLYTDTIAVGIWQRMGLYLFDGHTTVQEMERLDAVGDRWHKENPGRIVDLVVIYPGGTGMSGREREKMVELIKRFESRRDASATVILATGLKGSLHRSILTGLHLVSAPPHPAKVFGRIDEAVRWLSPFIQTLCGQVDPAQLLVGCEQLQADFLAQRQKSS